MIGVWVGVLVVAVLRFVQSRERKLMPVIVLSVLLLVALSREPGARFASLWHLAAGLAGFAVVLAVAPYPPTRR
jgi:hypothetical protein